MPQAALASFPGSNGRIATSVRVDPFGTNEADIWTLRGDGTDPVNLTKSPAFETEPAWSPNGRRVVFSRLM
ncbi:MAG: hypothetical protein LC808_12130, partial [Actinobacteria bacterium]|nr:hypothetical protein [Actinomycetota bacterium]